MMQGIESPEMDRLREWQKDAVWVIIAHRRHLTGQEELTGDLVDHYARLADRLCDWAVTRGTAPWKEEQEQV